MRKKACKQTKKKVKRQPKTLPYDHGSSVTCKDEFDSYNKEDTPLRNQVFYNPSTLTFDRSFTPVPVQDGNTLPFLPSEENLHILHPTLGSIQESLTGHPDIVASNDQLQPIAELSAVVFH